jgi:hypothetical protein
MKQRERDILEPFENIFPKEKAGVYWTIDFATGYALRMLLETHLSKSKRHEGLASFIAEYGALYPQEITERILATLAQRFKDDRWFGDRTAQSYAIYASDSAQIDATCMVLISQEVGQLVRRPGQSAFTERSLPLSFGTVRRFILASFSKYFQQFEDHAVLTNAVEVDKIDAARTLLAGKKTPPANAKPGATRKKKTKE